MAREAFSWLFAHTGYRKIQAFIAEDNRLAYRLAKRIGMKDEGRAEAAIERHGRLVDWHILGMTEAIWQQR